MRTFGDKLMEVDIILSVLTDNIPMGQEVIIYFSRSISR